MVEKTQTGTDKETDQQDEEEFVLVETDDQGKPLVQKTEGPGDEDDDDDDSGDDGLSEDDDVDVRAGHAEGEQDELADTGETPDEKRERRRRENRAKRIRARVAGETKDRLIASLHRTVLDLNERVNKVEGRSTQYNVNLIKQHMGTVQGQMQEAKQTLASLVKAGDGEGVAEATEIQMQLRDQFRYLQMQLQRAEQAEQQEAQQAHQQQQRQQPAVHPEVQARAEEWAAEHRWLDFSNPNSPAVATVRNIDRALHREGMNPATDAYWVELTKRVRRQFPQQFKRANGNGQLRTGGRVATERQPSPGPRMATSSQTGVRALGRNEVYISPERKKAMQEAGAWDDPEKRKRMLKSYAKYDRENAPQ